MTNIELFILKYSQKLIELIYTYKDKNKVVKKIWFNNKKLSEFNLDNKIFFFFGIQCDFVMIGDKEFIELEDDFIEISL